MFGLNIQLCPTATVLGPPLSTLHMHPVHHQHSPGTGLRSLEGLVCGLVAPVYEQARGCECLPAP